MSSKASLIPFAVVTLSTLASLLLISTLVAQEVTGHCLHCNRHSSCTKVCRLVCEEKKVDVTLWGCEKQDFCVPGPSTPAGEHCESVGSQGKEGLNAKVCSQPKKVVWTQWTAICAKVFTKKKLMKRTTTVTIPSHKWVVEDVCGNCKLQMSQVEKTTLDQLPPVPQEFKQFPLVVSVEPDLKLLDSK